MNGCRQQRRSVLRNEEFRCRHSQETKGAKVACRPPASRHTLALVSVAVVVAVVAVVGGGRESTAQAASWYVQAPGAASPPAKRIACVCHAHATTPRSRPSVVGSQPCPSLPPRHVAEQLRPAVCSECQPGSIEPRGRSVVICRIDSMSE